MTVDLSAITDNLINLVKTQWTTAPLWTELGVGSPTFTPNFTGLAPDAASRQSGPQLGLYLYHIETNNATESLFWQPQITSVTTEEGVNYLPMALDLFYLLYSYSESNFIEEQQSVSVAMRIFHGQPVVRSDPSATVAWELAFTPEHRSYDELSRLWQATTAPLRMALVYRAAVVIIDPDTMPPPAPITKSMTISVGQADVAGLTAGTPTLVTTRRQVTIAEPDGSTRSYSQSPATAAAGQTVWLVGSGLGGSATASVYLIDVTGTETEITTWMDTVASNADRVVLDLPGTGGAAPGGAPAPGAYQVRLGTGTLGSAGAYRGNAIALSIAPLVSPTGGPVLSGAAPYTISGVGFEVGTTVVSCGTFALEAVTTTPTAGQFEVASDTSIVVDPPTGPSGLVVPIEVTVNGVAADQALWVTL